ncbi:branched-chain amino acid transport system II carrier protein [Arenibacter sp. GZD96]|uniref:branched-chain amino acid transport system II carrier protein n=1 Tax=Aurantibrevibacter litoralis TaxID=3106030 RepID=UPI002AFE091D|nr:branched-chain amino acid transport system II carrier protein [Arenibacter sp. GZD-96]MEA1787498.1 branched-chain amino acid transport system II carrier protein [Arenibacter sp. GZD-96]
MHKTRETLIASFALFSLFFGAGNLILPPLLGFKSGDQWWLVTLGFCISAVFFAILGVLAHAKLQGTMFDFAKKVSPTFSLVYSLLVYAISISLPSPRTASVTHEMAIAPFFGTSSLLTSIVYFGLVFVFVMNRSKILDILGKFLTPAIVLILVMIIGITLFSSDFVFGATEIAHPFSYAILEGYQTFDAIGAVVVGGVIIISINLKNENASYTEKRNLMKRMAWFSGLGLFLIYTGLILTGALLHNDFDSDISRTALLTGISTQTLGNTANLLLSILVALACFTTAVGIVTGTADFIQSRFGNAPLAYTLTGALGCALGVLMGQFQVAYIIAVALPALMFIYPITLVLILLNVLPDRWASPFVFKIVVATTALFSVPDFLKSLNLNASTSLVTWLPLQEYHMGWVLPAIVAFVVCNVMITLRKPQNQDI